MLIQTAAYAPATTGVGPRYPVPMLDPAALAVAPTQVPFEAGLWAGLMTRLMEVLSHLMLPAGEGDGRTPIPPAQTTESLASTAPNPPNNATGTPPAARTGRSGAPSGYRPIQGKVPTGVVAKAKSLLSLPMGSEVPFELDGKRYLARLENHYHPPGYQGGPNGWHKGVSVYEAA